MPSTTDLDRWLLEPSTPFVRDVRGSAWVDSATERTLRGRPKRVRASRISSYADQIGSHYATDLRDDRFLLVGLARFSRTELEALASFDPDDPKAMAPIDAALDLAKREAGLWWLADRGTLVHAILEYDDRGAEVPAVLLEEAVGRFRIEEHVIARLRANWRAMLARYGLRVLAIEQSVVADEFNAAGTLDRLVELQRELVIGPHTIAAGTVLVLDVKTSALWLAQGAPAYWGPYACQVYLYAGSTPYLVGVDKRPDRRVPWPFEVDVTHGLIGHVNLNPLDGQLGACSIWHADLAIGRELAVLAQLARRYEARRDVFVAAP